MTSRTATAALKPVVATLLDLYEELQQQGLTRMFDMLRCLVGLIQLFQAL